RMLGFLASYCGFLGLEFRGAPHACPNRGNFFATRLYLPVASSGKVVLQFEVWSLDQPVRCIGGQDRSHVDHGISPAKTQMGEVVSHRVNHDDVVQVQRIGNASQKSQCWMIQPGPTMQRCQVNQLNESYGYQRRIESHAEKVVVRCPGVLLEER